jgi:DNA-binding NtrC family response regulator
VRHRNVESIPSETMEALMRWDWPGNTREIKNLIERAIILSKGPVLNVPLAGLWNEQGASSTLQQPIGFSESKAAGYNLVYRY